MLCHRIEENVQGFLQKLEWLSQDFAQFQILLHGGTFFKEFVYSLHITICNPLFSKSIVPCLCKTLFSQGACIHESHVVASRLLDITLNTKVNDSQNSMLEPPKLNFRNHLGLRIKFSSLEYQLNFDQYCTWWQRPLIFCMIFRERSLQICWQHVSSLNGSQPTVLLQNNCTAHHWPSIGSQGISIPFLPHKLEWKQNVHRYVYI